MAKGLFGGGNGTSVSPYLIEDADDFFAINKKPSAFYRLARSINMSQAESLNDGVWPDLVLTGTLDGAGYSIVGVNITTIGKSIFSFISGSVRNLMVDSPIVAGDDKRWDGKGFGIFASTYHMSAGNIVENVIIRNGTHYALSGSMFSGVSSNVVMKNCGFSGAIRPVGINTNDTVSATMIVGFSKRCSLENVFCNTRTRARRRAFPVDGTKNCFVNTDLIYNSDLSPGHETAKNNATMFLAETYSSWKDEKVNLLQNTWSISDGRLPDLYFNRFSLYLVKTAEGYMKPVNGLWQAVELAGEEISQEDFETHGMSESELALITPEVWNRLRRYGEFELVNMTDLFRAVESYLEIGFTPEGQIADGHTYTASIIISDVEEAIHKIYLKR